ncbi:glycerol-3-phosphate mitochondrial [Diplodia corticola]|uniref:Glycerol-3-phosphate mitochondrial n=1 Tax=Diplodia corticola TaxID=236234 RepID=A0A1J9S0Y9_9PEZI|nr:glycerol-3-phosphate mitochondrial [Diplodia corticola]OJD33325.1 glycerol-3-phosphate mitochondrial [Diplodia corticola]
MTNDPKDSNNASHKDAAKHPAADRDDANANPNSNPFISFRRYADDQIFSLMNSVMSIPATLSKEHERWNAARQNGDSDGDSDTQVTGTGRQEVWVKRWSSDDSASDGQDGKKKQDDDLSSWVKIWRPDGQQVKPEVVEDQDGGKTWHWSGSWSWPPKKGVDDSNSNQAANGNDELDRNFEEARRNAEKELHEMSELLKSWFGAEDDHGTKEDPQQVDRGRSLLDWIGLGDGSGSSDMRQGIEDRIKRLEDEFFNVRDSFSGLAQGRGPWTHLRISDEAREGSQILQILDGLQSASQHQDHPFGGFPMARGWGHPLSYFLDYSNPRTRWLLQHPYSPAVLEAEAIKNGVVGTPRYADAFEDLMRAERGCMSQGSANNDWSRAMWPRSYRLLSNVYSRSPRTQDFFQNVEEGGEWYVPEKQQQQHASQAQLAAPTSLPPFYNPASEDRRKEAAHDDHMYERFLGTHTADPKTELDMYERFLGDSSSHHGSGSGSGSSQQPPAVASPPSNSNRNTSIDVASSPILSTITTTERNVAADGTVTTKVTLKKRFADGREESSETVNTSRGDPTASGGGVSEEGTGSNKKKGGWFWSG